MAEWTEADDGTYARFSRFLDTHVQFVLEDGAVVEVTFPERAADTAGDDHPLLDRIDAYLSGTDPEDFDDVRVRLELPADEVEILEAVREIPYGEAHSVKELLHEVLAVDDADTALVREALDANPVPLLIPDHRVRAGPSGAPPRIEQRLRSLERIVT